MKTIILLVLLTVTLSLAQQLRVDSVTVDSVWNSDSSWYDGQGILQQRTSRDCFVGFKPMGQGMAQCYIALSIDSGNTWAPSPNPLIVLDNGIVTPSQCGTKGRVKLRVLGADRQNVVFRITGRQYKPVISGAPQRVTMGVFGTLTPGNSCEVTLKCNLDNVAQGQGFAPVAKVYWDGLGDGSWDDSTSTLNWVWQTTVPLGNAGQRRAVIAKAQDLNGLWSDPETLTVQFGLTRSLTMVSIPAGSFQMGDADYATPIHQVTLSAFKMGSTEVTQELYEDIMGVNPSAFDSGASWPVENVTWFVMVLFCNALSKVASKDTVYTYTGISGNPGDSCSDLAGISYDTSKSGYRLPTEAEWEYACRAGSTTKWYWSDTWSATADQYSWNSQNSNSMTHIVGGKTANAWGLYDMAGNVWEWVNDWYGSYGSAAQTNPTGAVGGSNRVLRGGSYFNGYGSGFNLRSGYRYDYDPYYRFNGIGFRVACRP